MSIKITSAIWSDAEELTGTTLLVALALADFSDDRGVSWPAVETIASKARVSESTARRHIQVLVDAGYLTIEVRKGRSSRYVLSPQPSVDEYTPVHPSQSDTPVNLEGVSPVTGGGVTAMTGGGVTAMTPEPSRTVKEPSLASDKPTRARDVLFETLARVGGIHDWSTLTKSERGRLNRAAKELRDIGATPEEVERRAEVYGRVWPNLDVTPTAIAANWSKLADTLKPKAVPESKKRCHCGQRFDMHDGEACFAVIAEVGG